MTDYVSMVMGWFRPDSVAGPMLDAVVRTPPQSPGPSIADLARQLRVDQSKALREADRLVAVDLLRGQRIGRARVHTINPESPLYRPVLELLYLCYGTTEPNPGYVADRWLDAQVRLAPEVAKFVPEELQPVRPRSPISPELPGESYDGPSLLDARDRAAALARLGAEYGRWRGLYQETYRRWHQERDRDLIHRLGLVGAGLGEAVRALDEAADHAQQRSQPSPRVCRRAWALAVFCVHAEAVRLQRHLIDWCVDGMAISDEHATLTASASRDRERLASVTDPTVRQKLNDRLADTDQRLWDLETHRKPYFCVGGTPSADDIGTAGERTIVAALQPVAKQLNEHVGAMSAAHCFEPWRAQLVEISGW